MKLQTKIINFNQVDLEGNIFTKDTEFYFPKDIKIIKKEDGLYIETNSIKNFFFNTVEKNEN